MSGKLLIVQITIADEDSLRVEEQFVQTYTGSYGYEVESMFDRLGKLVAVKMDPYAEKADA